MKKFLRKYFLIFPVLVCIHPVFCQNITPNDFIMHTDSVRGSTLTSLKTNVLAEVLQASVTNGIISSNQSGINLNATLFGIKKLFNPSLVIDTNYAKEKFSRNFEIGAGVNVANDNKIDGFHSSFKYAIINHRDISQYNAEALNSYLLNLNKKITEDVGNFATVLNNKIAIPLNRALADTLLSPTDKATIFGAFNKFNSSQSDIDFANLRIVLLPYMVSGRVHIDNSIFDEFPRTDSLINQEAVQFDNEIKKRALLTLSFANDYSNNSWDSLLFSIEYLKGLGWSQDVDKPWDIYAAAFFSSKQDTVRKRSLGRQVATIKLGLNKVLAKKNDGSSFVEILGTAEYDYISKGLYSSEKSSTFMADFTLTVRLAKSIFLPFELKYDPSNGNVFGFLSLKWDFLRASEKSNK